MVGGDIHTVITIAEVFGFIGVMLLFIGTILIVIYGQKTEAERAESSMGNTGITMVWIGGLTAAISGLGWLVTALLGSFFD
ncbi:MAG: hypothetical protein Harvfovirus41_5 [Harvfovirus sp.]|uniref:Uncharacterized protein n=1 Tax=Harvfovirus sp. TaxID=2487768 RepID=A0A3G5A340_9VIRU|nr:MAG: hypothetical protein Harvfovirus41_5 [Harvfovirus sp.]